MKRFGLAVKAIIRDEQGRCLLVRRSAANRGFVGAWEWPGGKVDPGEDFAAALVRELREEAGLEVELTGFAGATSVETAGGTLVLLFLEARKTGGAVRLSEEHDAYEWTPMKELGTRPLPPRVGDFMIEYGARA